MSSVETLSTFISVPVSIPLGAISLAGASISGVTMAPTKKYQKKLGKVTKLADIVMSVIAVFEMSVFKVLDDGKIDEEEFNMLQTLHLKALNELSKVDHKMGAENSNQFERKFNGRDKRHKETHRNKSFMICSFFLCVILHVTSKDNLKWTSSKILTINLITCGKDKKHSGN